MSATAPLSLSPDNRATRFATRAVFFTTGMAMGLWAALVPYVQNRTGAEANQLGMLLLCLGAGSLLSMSFSGILIKRVGCRAVMVLSAALWCAVLPLLATLDSLELLGVALFVFGMGIGLTDVAMNVQGTLVEQAAGRALMSGFHCLWSVGGIAGAAGGALLFGNGAAPLTSTFCAIAITAGVLLAVFRGLLPGGSDEKKTEQPRSRRLRPDAYLLMMAIMTMLCFMAEGAIIDWSGTFLNLERGMPLEHAGWGFALFSLAMSLMRMTGDRLVNRMGRRMMLVAGSLLAMVGYLVVILVPGWTASLIGFALVGIGAANIVPVLITLAGQSKAMPVSMSVAFVTSLGYLGILGGPALLGWIAHYSTLFFAFSLLAAGFLLIALGAARLRY